MRDYQGEISIEGADFWNWVVENYLPDTGDEVAFGTPTWDKKEQCLNIEYAGSSHCHPDTWAKKPKFR